MTTVHEPKFTAFEDNDQFDGALDNVWVQIG